jgi:hypothetical protein
VHAQAATSPNRSRLSSAGSGRSRQAEPAGVMPVRCNASTRTNGARMRAACRIGNAFQSTRGADGQGLWHCVPRPPRQEGTHSRAYRSYASRGTAQEPVLGTGGSYVITPNRASSAAAMHFARAV